MVERLCPPGMRDPPLCWPVLYSEQKAVKKELPSM
jgi:hypothetical protein